MNWIQISIYTNEESFDIICGALDTISISQVELIESVSSVEDFLEQSAKTWDYCDLPMEVHEKPCVRFYLPDDIDGQLQLSKANDLVNNLKQNKAIYIQQNNIDLGILDISTKILAEEDWENNWKQYFKPFSVGNKFVICPSWETYNNINQEKKILYIDPGMVFGTGLHQTTQLCLCALENIDCENKKVLDLGCGSGILSIGSLLLGAKNAFAIDIETHAPRIVAANLAANSLDETLLTAVCGNIIEDTNLQENLFLNHDKFNIILVNIVADVLIQIAPLIPKLLDKSGTCIFSGIIQDRLEEVQQTILDNNLTIIKTTSKDDWFCVEFCK